MLNPWWIKFDVHKVFLDTKSRQKLNSYKQLTKKISSNTNLSNQDKTSENSSSNENHKHNNERINSLGFIDVVNFFDNSYDKQKIQFSTESVFVSAENNIDFVFFDIFFVKKKQSLILLNNVDLLLTNFEMILNLFDKIIKDIQKFSEKNSECEKSVFQMQKKKFVISLFAENYEASNLREKLN